MHTVFDFAAKRAEIAPDAIAFEEADSGRRIMFAAFNERAERGAAALERMGVAAGERVAILCHNSVVFFEVLFACGKAGAILVPLNWRQTPTELAPVLADCGARILLHDAATAPLAHALARSGEARLVGFDAWETLLDATAPAPARDTAWATDRVWYLLYTSGTTGRPKAVIQTVGMALANYINVQQATGLTAADRRSTSCRYSIPPASTCTRCRCSSPAAPARCSPSSRSTRCST